MLISGEVDVSRDNQCEDYRQSTIEYRGEGNSSLVVALSKERHVIRLLKTQTKTSDTCQTSAQVLHVLKSHIRFNSRVLSRIFSDHFFRAPQLVRLSSEQIRAVHALSDQRPAHRLRKGVHASLALLLPDYCNFPQKLSQKTETSGPLLAVEIKPKQGFLPHAHLLKDELRVKARVCRFGLNQFHKLKKGSIQKRSEYCPLDLFSGCPHRQTRALHALIASPQNNLRVFRDLKLAFGDQSLDSLDDVIRDVFPFSDDTRRRDAFCRLIVVALNKCFTDAPPLRPDPRWPQNQSCRLHASRCTCSSGHVLAAGSVLSAVLCAQRLDSLDSYLAYEWWAGLSKNNNEGEGLEDKLTGDWLPEFLSDQRAETESESEFVLRKVWQFLVSLTAKDCSIMIALQRADAVEPEVESHVVWDEESATRFLLSVRITDLDQKPPEKIERCLWNDTRMCNIALSGGVY